MTTEPESKGKRIPDVSVKREIKQLNQTAKRALVKNSPEHKKIFDTHAKAWKELANK